MAPPWAMAMACAMAKPSPPLWASPLFKGAARLEPIKDER